MQTIPLNCRPEAYDLFAAQLPILETTDGLLGAATAISMHVFDDLDPDDIDCRLLALASRVRSRVRGNNLQAVVAHLHHVLFEEEGFAGNIRRYYHPLNSFLPAVLELRRGIPITLSLIYKVVAERAGLEVEGVNAPGHFMVRVLSDRHNMLVDPFYRGCVLSEAEAFGRIEQATRGPVPRRDEFLRAATHHEWISRILTNLQYVYSLDNRVEDLAAMTELQTLLEAATKPALKRM